MAYRYHDAIQTVVIDPVVSRMSRLDISMETINRYLTRSIKQETWDRWCRGEGRPTAGSFKRVALVLDIIEAELRLVEHEQSKPGPGRRP